ncbi:MAG: outer membrane protein assembly factor BamA [Candidatus Tectomicrobia bacterium]|nr:outer membrane protein assembly factor BamA [Candidatus Tectomicrobia bacterium]
MISKVFIRACLLISPGVFLSLVVMGCAGLPFFKTKQKIEGLITVEKLTIEGNTHFPDSEIKEVLGTKKRPFLPWKEVDYFNPQVLQEDLKRIRKFYFDRGYLHTQVKEPEVVFDEEARTVQITMTIEEGGPTILKSITFEGITGIKGTTIPELQKAILLKEREPLSPKNLDQSKVEILNRVRNQGYARAKLDTKVEINEQEREGRVTFNVAPGEITYFGKTRIEGDEQVKQSFIQRGLGFKEGERFTLEKLYDSQRSLFNRGLFERIRLEPVNLDAEGEPVDILVTVKEAKMRSIRFGIGYGTEDQLRVQGSWTHRNLFGGGQKLTVGGKASFILQEVSTSFQQPFFLDRATDLNGEISYRQEDQVSFGVTTLSVTTRINRSFSSTLKGFLSYNLQFNEFRNVSSSTAALLPEEAVESNRITLFALGLQRDTSDDLFNPTRGLVTTLVFEHSDPFLGSEFRFLKGTAEAKNYLSLTTGVILASRLKFGSIKSFDDTEVIPLNQRFFSGGSTSIRSFERNRLGPLDRRGEPLGGNSLLEGSLELRFPVFVKGLQGVVFADLGNIYPDFLSFNLSDLRYAAGPGIRYNTPIGPLRLDLGFKLDRRQEEDSFEVHFSIGQAF